MTDLVTPATREVSATFEMGRPGFAAMPGEAIKGIGEEIGNFAGAMQRAQDQSSLVQARLDGTRQLDDLFNQYKTDPDPATATQRFQKDATAIGLNVGKTLKGATPDAQNAFTSEFGQMAEERRIRVGDVMFDRQRSDALGNLQNLIEQQAANAAYATTAAGRTIALNTVQKSIAGNVATGMLPASEGDKYTRQFNERLALYDGKHAINVDPVSAAKNLNNPNYLPSLDPLSRQELIDNAQAQVREREREARAALAEQRAQASESLSGLQATIASGLPVSQDTIDQAKNDVMASGDPRQQYRLAGLLKANGFAMGLRGATPQEVTDGMAAIEREADAHGANEAMATALIASRKFSETMHAALQHDPLMWANQQGVTQIAPLKLNGTDSAQAWSQRVRAADLVAQHYGITPQYLTAAEKEQLETSFAKNADPDARLATIKTIAQGLGTRASPVFAELGDKQPAIATAAGLLLNGPAHATAARDILAGEQSMAARPELRPERVVRQANSQTTAAQAGAAYAQLPGEAGRVLDAADAIYAARASGRGFDGKSAATGDGLSLYDRAVQEASGARFDQNGVQWGGIATERGYPVVVPPTMTAHGFGETLHNLTEADLDHASASGQPPRIGGKPLPAGTLRALYPVTGGDGLYLLSTTNPAQGTTTPVRDAHGVPYRLDIAKAASILQARARKAAAP